MVENTMKHCSRCQENKKNEEFSKDASSPTGLTYYCRLCNKNSCAQHRREFKEKCIDYLGGICWSCSGEFPVSVFDFHHLDPAQKDVEVSKLTFRPWEVVMEELDKCALLCSNCHRQAHILER
jgi:hypothetical protein